MTDKAKDTVIGIPILVISILSFILMFRQPKVIKEVKTVEKRVYVTASATITGATNVTTLANGTATASGTNVTVVCHSTSTTTVTEQTTTKYDYCLVMLGGRINTAGDYAIDLSAKLSTFVVGLEYAPSRQTWGVRAGIVLFEW